MSGRDAIRGRVWRFGDDVSTDVLSPGEYAIAPVEVRKAHTLEALDPRFPAEVGTGDVVVAGRNFGCGSSRESAPENLKELGVGCVVAESFARIFLRNAVAIGLPVLACPGAPDAFAAGDELEADLASGVVRNATTRAVLQGEPLPPEMRAILAGGGVLAALRSFARG